MEIIGDVYMVVGGLLKLCDNYVEKVVYMVCLMMEVFWKVLLFVDKIFFKVLDVICINYIYDNLRDRIFVFWVVLRKMSIILVCLMCYFVF